MVRKKTQKIMKASGAKGDQSPRPPTYAHPSVLASDVDAGFSLLHFATFQAEEGSPRDRLERLERLSERERRLQLVRPNILGMACETARTPLRTSRRGDFTIVVEFGSMCEMLFK